MVLQDESETDVLVQYCPNSTITVAAIILAIIPSTENEDKEKAFDHAMCSFRASFVYCSLHRELMRSHGFMRLGCPKRENLTKVGA